ncbi:MAG TPA: hypothetical protein VFQ35_26940, partial [Polyangiaceae bacterium]|nr:hypothetical protein [Polyangiaceae bacterium]
ETVIPEALEPNPELQSEPEPVGSARPAPSAASSAPHAATGADLAREIAVLDSARRALAAGNPAEALNRLDGEQPLSVRTLAPEATVLRVRALLRLGRRSAARAVVERFAHDAPGSPQLAVLRELLHADSNL